jgi:hypothetical protein
MCYFGYHFICFAIIIGLLTLGKLLVSFLPHSTISLTELELLEFISHKCAALAFNKFAHASTLFYIFSGP